eukprot:3713184-Prymnesium_polylepis.1
MTTVRSRVARCLVWVDRESDCTQQSWEPTALSNASTGVFTRVAWGVPWLPFADSASLLLMPSA